MIGGHDDLGDNFGASSGRQLVSTTMDFHNLRMGDGGGGFGED